MNHMENERKPTDVEIQASFFKSVPATPVRLYRIYSARPVTCDIFSRAATHNNTHMQ